MRTRLSKWLFRLAQKVKPPVHVVETYTSMAGNPVERFSDGTVRATLPYDATALSDDDPL